MNEQENSSLEGNTKHNRDKKTQDNAKATDSWLTYLSRDLGKAFSWSKNEMDLLVDSARCAFNTTKKITKKWYSPQVLADRANDGFLFVVRSSGKGIRSIQSGTGKGFLSIARSTGKTVHFIQSGTVNGISKVGQVLSRRKKGKIKQQTKPVQEECLPQEAIPEASADAQQEDAASPDSAEAVEPGESTPAPVTVEEEPPQEEVFQEVAEEISDKEDAPEEVVASEPQITAASQDEKQAEPVQEECLPQEAIPEASADAQPGDAASPASSEAVEPGESTPDSVDMEAVLKQHREHWQRKPKKTKTKAIKSHQKHKGKRTRG